MAGRDVLLGTVEGVKRHHIGLIGSIAEGQDRLVRRDQLLRAGLSRHDIQSHLASELLTPVLWGLYVVGVPTLSHQEFLRAAVLHAGDGSQLAYRTAAEVGELLRVRTGRATVMTSRRGKRGKLRTKIALNETGEPGEIDVRVRTHLPEPVWVGALPIAPIPWAFADIAQMDGDRVLGWAWREAEYRGVLEIEAIRAALPALPRGAGIALLEDRVRRHVQVLDPDDHVRSRKELDFLHLIAAHGLPKPEVNVRICVGSDWCRPDYLWRLLGLALEFDGPSHLIASVREDDAIADAACFVDEIDVLRFPVEPALADPVTYIGLLRAGLERKSKELGIPLGTLPQFTR